MRIKKRKFLIIFLLLAIAGGGYAYTATKEKPATTATTDKYVKVKKDTVVETVSSQGLIETKDFVEVGAQVSGEVKKMHFQAGDYVKKGDLLAEIDPEIYESKLQGDRARLKTLNAQLQQQIAQNQLAKQQYDRNSALIKSDAVSKEALETSESNLKVSASSVDAYRAQVEEQQFNLKTDELNVKYTKIYAPMDGIVLSLAIREGQTINANQQAPNILTIANLDTMTLRAQVTEADVTRIMPGSKVYFTTLGSGKRRWEGTVHRIMPSPETSQEVVLYGALIDVKNKDRKLISGMSAQVFFVLNSATNVPTIPVEALGAHMEDKDNKTGQAYKVKTKTGEKLVYIGLMDRSLAEVKSGLGPNDEVLVASPEGA